MAMDKGGSVSRLERRLVVDMGCDIPAIRKSANATNRE